MIDLVRVQANHAIANSRSEKACELYYKISRLYQMILTCGKGNELRRYPLSGTKINVGQDSPLPNMLRWCVPYHHHPRT